MVYVSTLKKYNNKNIKNIIEEYFDENNNRYFCVSNKELMNSDDYKIIHQCEMELPIRYYEYIGVLENEELFNSCNFNYHYCGSTFKDDDKFCFESKYYYPASAIKGIKDIEIYPHYNFDYYKRFPGYKYFEDNEWIGYETDSTCYFIKYNGEDKSLCIPKKYHDKDVTVSNCYFPNVEYLFFEENGNIVLNYEALTVQNGYFPKLKKVNLNNSIIKNGCDLFCGSNELTDVIGTPIFNQSCKLDRMFSYCKSLNNIDDLTCWEMFPVISIGKMFERCYSIESIQPLSTWDTRNMTNFQQLFDQCINLKDVSPLSDWNVSKVTDTSWMFSQWESLESLKGLENWNTENLINMEGMFSACYKLSDIRALNNWNIGQVENICSLFAECFELSDFSPISQWQTGCIRYMANTFFGCRKLEKLDALAHWNLEMCEEMDDLFWDCTALKDLTGLTHWNTQNISIMSQMFRNCNSLKTLKGLENWNTESLVNMKAMFMGCSNLRNINALSQWNIKNVKYIQYLFSDCSSIKKINALKHWDTQSMEKMNYAFFDCSNLCNIKGIKYWNLSNVTDISGLFKNCNNLWDFTPLAYWTKLQDMPNIDSIFETSLSHKEYSRKYRKHMFKKYLKRIFNIIKLPILIIAVFIFKSIVELLSKILHKFIK